ncbi:MAG: class I adenylate cyclase [Nitrospinae bacterium]|nr:class I adenylate cyclase [Nitrospinota bacterium]
MLTLTPEQIKRQRYRFDMFNVARIYGAVSLFSPAENTVFGAVPLLLHANYTGIEGLKPVLDAPAGIQKFTPREQHLKALAEIAPGAAGHPAHNPKILSLALIGSLGTVAQTHKSDFDYILFIDKREFSQTDLFSLKRKLAAIEQWLYQRHRVEAHFFLQDIGEFRLNLFGQTDRDNVGSALGKLFKDEFYRTAIWVAGRKPLWWIIPPDYPELESAGLYAALQRRGVEDLDEYMDLGHLIHAEEEEFFGAALWQINKALGSPFKSVLKMGLLESYLFNPLAGLLCEEVKRRVLSQAGPLEEIDPYIMMFERANAYYAQRGMMKELALVKWAFILKTGIDPDDIGRLLRTRTEMLSSKEQVLAAIMKRWGWQGDEADDLQQLFTGDPQRRLSSVGKVYRYFIDAYIRLSDYKKEHGDKLTYITRDDMTVLGRKLFTHFEQAPGKIAFLHRAIPVEAQKLTLALEKSARGERGWELYTGNPSEVTAGISTVQPLNRLKSLVEMLAWMVINGIWKPKIKFYFRNEPGIPYAVEDVEYLLRNLHGYFTDNRHESSRDDYLGERTIIRAFVIPNFGLVESPGEIRRVDMILHDSWGEFRRVRMGINQALMEMAAMLSAAERAGNKVDLKVVSLPSQNDPRLAHEFEYSLAKTREAMEHETAHVRKATLDLD